MFVIGGKYRKSPEAVVMECVYVNGGQCVLKSPIGDLLIRYREDFKHYTEYKEPIKHVRYYNLYKGGPEVLWLNDYPSRAKADEGADLSSRIGRVRVEFTEGTYDD